MKHLLLIALAGGIGTAARYFVGSAAQKFLGAGFPWGTFTVNIVGCLLFGWVWGMQTVREAISTETRAILLIGFMGGFTTFSSFAFDNYLYIRDGSFGLAAVNIAAQNILGLLAVWAGIALAKITP